MFPYSLEEYLDRTEYLFNNLEEMKDSLIFPGAIVWTYARIEYRDGKSYGTYKKLRSHVVFQVDTQLPDFAEARLHQTFTACISAQCPLLLKSGFFLEPVWIPIFVKCSGRLHEVRCHKFFLPKLENNQYGQVSFEEISINLGHEELVVDGIAC